MSNVTKLSDAIKFALFVGAASSAASVTAFAQEAATEAKTLDRVEVTGSRIKKVDAESAQPVTVITRADIEKRYLKEFGRELPAHHLDLETQLVKDWKSKVRAKSERRAALDRKRKATKEGG